MFELFILGELTGSPMHGYLLHTILNGIIGPTRKISWGVLYPLIHSLLADGLIEQVPDEQQEGERQGRGKKKKMYRITEDGRRRFFRLMEEPIPYSTDYELQFYSKFSNFDMISRELQFLILHQYKDYLRFELRHEEERVEYVSKDEMMPDEERQYNLIWFRHRLDKLRYDEEWVLQLINNLRINGEGIEGERIWESLSDG
ncbi:PadR family transcriptional regulator [Paenibacillus tyrfis]|uniref:PadR family transcriptional regulator n=1 Tax=Paenibacillus tyrfis TaxID=1501230 RepID=A0A081P6Q3_9BACL|nr:PadR family transcriptional regulator [Paenibacillus tyrfis]KEQ26376.1 PadR family transcriptional regulator [Paenibacillus tyrfis]